MTVRTILTEPNKILRQISQPVDSVGKEEQTLMDDMLETMYAANGIGLARPMPFAAYIVSNISSISVCSSLPTLSTGCDICRKILFGSVKIVLTVIELF